MSIYSHHFPESMSDTGEAREPLYGRFPEDLSPAERAELEAWLARLEAQLPARLEPAAYAGLTEAVPF